MIGSNRLVAILRSGSMDQDDGRKRSDATRNRQRAGQLVFAYGHILGTKLRLLRVWRWRHGSVRSRQLEEYPAYLAANLIHVDRRNRRRVLEVKLHAHLVGTGHALRDTLAIHNFPAEQRTFVAVSLLPRILEHCRRQSGPHPVIEVRGCLAEIAVTKRRENLIDGGVGGVGSASSSGKNREREKRSAEHNRSHRHRMQIRRLDTPLQ